MPRSLLIAILFICGSLLFCNSTPAATRAFYADYIGCGSAQVNAAHSGHISDHTAHMGRRHVKPVNRRVKALNADLDTFPAEMIVFTAHIAHTEKVKTYILSTRFFSHKCGKLKLRGPPQLA